MDYFLKATDEATMWARLVEAGAAVTYDVKNQAGEVIETRHAPAEGYSIDVIGTIYRPTGNMVQQTGPDDSVIEVPEMAALEGFHVNMRGPADLAPKVEYVPYVPTEEEMADSEFVSPDPTEVVTPSPLADLLVEPKKPARVWF
jgi:hypothetical protein